MAPGEPGLCPSCGTEVSPDASYCSSCGASLLEGAGEAGDAPAGADGSSSPPSPGPLSSVPPDLEARLEEALRPEYLLVHKLDEGGMGSVWLAREPGLKRDVAVKVLKPGLAGDETNRKRFQREAQSAAGLAHPNVIDIYSVGELEGGLPYIVMEHVGGPSLSERLEAEGPMPEGEVKRLVGEVASALEAAHRRGIVHRDVKPSNVLYDEETGRALVTDFGIAAVRREEAEDGEASALTATGAFLGTPESASPEQVRGEEVTEQADLYALGLLGYRLLTGESPYDATTPVEMAAAHLKEEPRPLSDHRPDLDPELEHLVERCLAKDPAERPTAKEVTRRLLPGAGALLEWPPPGLEELQGACYRAGAPLLAGGLLVAVPALAAASAGPDATFGYMSATALLLTAALVTGGLSLLWGARRLQVAVGRTRKAHRLGYAWVAAAEVAADRHGDGGALIAGAGRFAALGAAERGRLRRRRIAAGLAFLAAGVAPLPLLLLAVRLGGGREGAVTLAWLVLGIPLIALLAYAWGSRLLERRRAAGEPSGGAVAGEASPEVVDVWYDSFEDARRGSRPGRGDPARLRPGWVGGAAAAVFAVACGLVAVPLVAGGVWGGAVLHVTSVRLSSSLDKMAEAEAVRPYRLPPDSTISPERAGRALHTLALVGDEDLPEAYASPARMIARPWFPAPPEGDSLFGLSSDELAEMLDPPRHLGRLVDGQGLLRRAARGFSRRETAYLEDVASHPGLHEVAVVARAPSANVLGARYEFPLPDDLTARGLPLPRMASVKDAGFAAIVRAALELSRGEVATAETSLREPLSVGLLMIRDGHSLIDALVGAVLVRNARDQLETYYRLTGRRAEAERLRSVVDSVRALQDVLAARSAVRGDGPAMRSPVDIRKRLLRTVRDSTRHRPVRWESLWRLTAFPCTNIHELLFGPGPDLRSAYRAASEELARNPEERAMVELYRTDLRRLAGLEAPYPVGTLPTKAVHAFSQAVGAALGNPRIPACTVIGLGVLR